MAPSNDDAPTVPNSARGAMADTLAADSDDTILAPASAPAPESAGSAPSASAGTTATGTGGPSAIAGAGARYALGRVLGRGGMGEVRLARDPRVDRDVAVKLMRDPGASEEAVARFLREARVQGRLEHPGVVPVHDLGVDDRGAPYFAMKRLTGTTLADALEAITLGSEDAKARWPRRLLLDRLVDICLAIEFAHERGVVHRDLKPNNIMLGDYGEAYVLDWGIARVGGETASIPAADLGANDPITNPTSSAQTAVGSMLGTPGYMSPEQMRGEPVDRRTDVYALGCVLFEILTQHAALPRGHDAYEATLTAGDHRPRARYPNADVPPELDDACARATAPDAERRTPTARELGAAIRAYLDGDRDTARRREIAQAHAEAAAAAWRTGDAGRADAMREAGQAISIDPNCRAAQDLLREILFTLPKARVAPVDAAVRTERERTARGQLRAAIVVYAAFLAFLLGLVASGTPLSWPLIGVASGLAANLAMMAWMMTRPVIPAFAAYLALAIHGVQLVFAGVLFSPLLVIPAFAIGSLASCLSYPLERRPIVIAIVHIIAIAIPFAGERLGWLPATMGTHDDAVVIRPWAVGVSPTAMLGFAIAAVLVQMVIMSLLITSQRDVQERAQEDIHLTKWHLDQLLPAYDRG